MRLRRPATIHQQDGVFVPEGITIEEVDVRWSQICAQNPACFDGRILHVLGVHRNGHGGANIHVVSCAYRFFAVQNDGLDLGIRPLGVKAITTCGTNYLWGKRSERVHHYKGLWEFAPAGTVVPDVNPDEVIANELHEETGLQLHSNPIQVGILQDVQTKTWELIYRMRVCDKNISPNGEYQLLEWISGDSLPNGRSPITDAMLQFV
jgi:hypothetical protein